MSSSAAAIPAVGGQYPLVPIVARRADHHHSQGWWLWGCAKLWDLDAAATGRAVRSTLYRRSRRSREAATISTTDVGPASNPLGRLRGCGPDPGQPPRPHSESAPAQPRPTATTAPNSMRRAHRFSPDHQPGEAAWMTPRPGIAAPPPTTPAPTRNPSDRLHRPPRTGPAACPPTR